MLLNCYSRSVSGSGTVVGRVSSSARLWINGLPGGAPLVGSLTGWFYLGSGRGQPLW